MYDDQEHDGAAVETPSGEHHSADVETSAALPGCTATYSAEDNKLRLYPAHRLDRATYERVTGAGFAWAPKQELFVAGRWTPEREDLLVELAGEIDDEETPLADRAAERAERFEVYSDKRGDEAKSAHAYVERIAGGIPMGQPILVGHHSEKHARRDAKRIENGMRAAVRLHETAAYWEHRAKRVTRHAAYKADPGLRARRIKVLEAEERSHRRGFERATAALALWTRIAGIEDAEIQRTKALSVANMTGPFGVWGDITDSKLTPADACAKCIATFGASVAWETRWLSHLTNRLAYERVLLGRAPDEVTKTPRRKSAKASLPLLNYRAESTGLEARNLYTFNGNGRTDRYSQAEMTAAEYAKIHADYKGTRLSLDGSHRFRIAVIRSASVAVFLTDSKVHPRPEPKPAPVVEAEPEEEPEGDDGPRVSPLASSVPPVREPEPAPVDPFEAMRASLKQGVKAVSVPELFVTPAELAARGVDEADVQPGARVLEPSAGLGALALSARARGATVVCVDNARAMIAALSRAGLETREGDFLAETPEALGLFDRVLMNPPFSAELEHVMHAWTFLAPGGRLVAIMSAGARHNGSKKHRAFRVFVEEHGTMETLPAGSFASSGTGVNTVLVVLDKPGVTS